MASPAVAPMGPDNVASFPGPVLRRVQDEHFPHKVIDTAPPRSQIVGDSSAIRQLLQQIELVAPTDANVLILGESGTGKELVANRIHEYSERREQPLIRINCAAVPRDLFESEFFGHVRGAFSGAIRDRAGHFERANGGTLFLDEIAEIPLELQGKLLRVLQEGQCERVGDERVRCVDVRVIAATNVNLMDEVCAGRFREDLYYRLNVIPLEVPPLRKRAEDIPQLANHFLRQITRKLKRPSVCPIMQAADMQLLQDYAWPGNVRELHNIIERAVILSRGDRLALNLPVVPRRPHSQLDISGTVLTEDERKQLDRKNILAALETANGKVYGPKGAAAILHLKPTTLASRMKALGIARSDGR